MNFYLKILNLSKEQRVKILNTNFNKFLHHDSQNDTVCLYKNSDLCKSKLFTLYKCILYWIDLEKIRNTEVILCDDEDIDDGCNKKRKLLKSTHSVDAEKISNFLVNTNILYSKNTNDYYVSFKKNEIMKFSMTLVP